MRSSGPCAGRRENCCWALTACVATLGCGIQTGQAQTVLPVPCASGVCTTGPATFVTSGSAGYVVSGTTGTVTQQSERAILNWQSFDIAPGHSVEFRQPSSTSAALNRIYQQDPSRILGSLTANGQVYLVNPNGIVFGQGAQVNARGLVASSLNVSDRIFNDVGITGAINLGDNPAAAQAAFEGGSAPDAIIRVESGASIRGDERVLIIAPSVENRGTITTVGGQAILAASADTVYLASDKDLRGLLVEVGTGGSVANLGNIIAERGNVTLAGLAVNQSGRITATTSVNVNGSVRLLARDGADPSQFTVLNNGQRQPVAARAGTLTFGAASVTEVRPELDSDEVAVDAQVQQLSRIEGMGRTIAVEGGARIVAPGGVVSLTATSRPATPLSGSDRSASLFIGAGALIDVAGDDSAVVAMERNQASIKLFGNELADAPLQRDGPLARQEITVDLREGTPLTDISRLREDVQRGVGERLSVGGSIQLAAEGDTVLQPGSILDVSGGQVRYLDGHLQTTRLVALDGSIVDIADADPSLPYLGIATQYDTGTTKWGVTERTPVQGFSTFQPGYVEGHDAGSIALRGANVVVGGTLVGGIARGRLQRDPANSAATGLERAYTEIPLRGLLELSRTNPAVDGGPTVQFVQSFASSVPVVGNPLPADTPLLVPVDQLVAGGFNRLTVESAGLLLLPEDVDLDLAAGASIALSANAIEQFGDIRSPSARINLVARATNTAPGSITLGSDASIDVAGQWVNDSTLVNGGNPGVAERFLDGGAVSLLAQGDLTLDAGSEIDASAGATAGESGRTRSGRAGSIALASAIPNQNTLTTLDLRGELRAYGFGTGGTLSLTGVGFRVAEASSAPGAGIGEVLLAPEFFGDDGFGRLSFTATRGGFVVDDGVVLDLNPTSLQLTGDFAGAATGSDLGAITQRVLLPEPERGPTSLAVTVQRAPFVATEAAPLRIGDGARISTQPGGSIQLASDTDVYVGGALTAPGGSVRLTLNNPTGANDTGFRASQAIRLGAGALLDASGVARVTVDDLGRRTGEVTSGGSVALTANRGYVISAAGSLIDVSGTSTVLDLPGPSGAPMPTVLPSDAGSVRIQAAEGALLSGDVRGLRGGSGAAGGSYVVVLNARNRDPNDIASIAGPGVTPFPESQRQIVVGGPFGGYFDEGVAVPDTLNGRATVAAAGVTAGGFDDVLLNVPAYVRPGIAPVAGAILFNGNTTLEAGRSIVLDAVVVGSIGQSASVLAPYVALGPTESIYRASASPLAGDGSLSIAAEHIDLVGDLTLGGFREGGTAPAVSLNSSGDLRLVGVRFGDEPTAVQAGSLTALADVALTASRIYPATLTDYSIEVLAPDGRIVVLGGRAADAQTPLSAAGRLQLNAAEIVQGGTLWAPFGLIELNASRRLDLRAGSLTSTSGAGAVIPFGVTEFGESWVYPLGDVTRVLSETPGKSIVLTAPEIALATGSTVDLSGGGDLLAYEFIKGPGGSRDVLLGDNPDGAFAIVPADGSRYGVFDPFESPAAGIVPGSTIRLGGGGGVPAGEYAILPARYALLPGAFLVTPVDGFDGIQPGTARLLGDGVTPVVAGRLASAGTEVQAARWTAFVIENGAQVRGRSEYLESRASTFFADAGLPRDAGSLVIDAGRSVQLAGTLAAATAGGRAAQVDFVADRLAVVTARTQDDTRVELLDSELQNFGAASLLLGGVRSGTTDAAQLTVGAESIVIGAGVELQAGELLLAATDDISIETGVRLAAIAAATGAVEPRALAVNGDGALVQVSSANLLDLQRSGTTGAYGDVTVAAGATLVASGAITVDATRNVALAGDLRAGVLDDEGGMIGGSIALGASAISLGAAPDGTTGLVLDAADLQRLQADTLELRSAQAVDLHDSLEAEFESLRIEAAGLRGFGSGDVVLSASALAIANPQGRVAASPGNGAGTLTLSSNTLELGPGAFDVSGFARTRAIANDELAGHGIAALRVAGDLMIETSRIVGADDAALTIDASGRLGTLATNPGVDYQPQAPALGSSIVLVADTIDHATRIVAPSGRIVLRATGTDGVTLRETAVLDVAGRVVDFELVKVGSPGGSVSLVADSGAVRLAGGSVLDVSTAGAGAAAGRVSIQAQGASDVSGSAVMRGTADAGETQGRFELQAEELSAGFSALNRVLNEGGLSGRRSVTVDRGDLVIAAEDTVRADDVELVAAGGRIELLGRIDAANPTGGIVRLAARDELWLHSDSSIDARATGRGQPGGVVRLETTLGTLRLESTGGGPIVNVAGTAASGAVEQSGYVHVRAPRVGPDGLAATVDPAGIAGAARIDVEAFRVYETATIDASLVDAIQSDTALYMANAAAIEAAAGVAGDPRFVLLPGVEVASAGDLTLAADWDLSTWRYDGAAGMLTLRAANDLDLQRSLSDGLVRGAIDPALPERDIVQTGPSWSYRLIAGSNGLAATPGSGDVVIGDGARVRTGTGSIAVVAGRDLVFASGNAALYTVGENRGSGGLAAFDAEVLLRGDFVHRGGSISVNAGRHVSGVSDRPLPDWQPRVAGEFPFYQPGVVFPAAWAIDAGKFQQGIGALGGGNVSIVAGGDLQTLTVALPTNGRPGVDAANDAGDVAGGGDLRISVDGDVQGGFFHLGAGSGRIVAGGSITRGGDASALNPVLALGDASLSLQARNGVAIETVYNPTVAEPDPTQGLQDYFFFPQPSYFFTYGPDSGVEMQTVRGDALIQARGESLLGYYGDRLIDPGLLALYPGTLRATSLEGDVVVAGTIDLFPAPTGDLRLLAANDVTSDGASTLTLSDADIAQLPTRSNPSSSLNSVLLRQALSGHAPRPVHAGDSQPVLIVARDGTIGTGQDGTLALVLAKQARILAGEDVSNLTLSVQHANAADISVVEAGRDISYTTLRRPNGTLATNNNFIDVAGPGRIDLLAGRDIDFGSAVGVVTRGNLSNPALADRGADISLWTGLQTPPDFASFIDKYLAQTDRYDAALAVYLRGLALDSPGNDVDDFRSLPQIYQREFIQDVLFAEIKRGGLGDIKDGYAAIETLFPEADEEVATDYAGDLKSFLSRISTLDGGGIDILVPGGFVNAGVASSGSISKRPDELGIVVQREGDVRAFVESDFLVNSSRVFSLDGGDILIWSSDADIDAGRGARSAIAIPPPTISFDADGNVVVEFPPSISGSGIRTAVTTEGREPGDVFLFAPTGVVDAGDAGIQSAGNITVVAVQVIGADNISAGGVSVGVPVDSGGLGASLSAASSASSSAASVATDAGEGAEEEASLADDALSWLDVFVVGLGEDSCDPKDLECIRRQKKTD